MTNWLDRLNDSFNRFLDGPALEQRASSGFGVSVPTYQVDQPRWLDANVGTYRKAFASQVAVYACVLARARGVSSAPVRVYQEQEGDRTEIPDHPMRMLMQRPNPMMSEAEFLVMTQTLMDSTGFAAIEKVRAGAGNVVELWHLRSDWLKEIRRSQRPSDWEYVVPGNKPVTLKAEDILIVPGGPSTDLGTIGMSPIAVALREVGIDAGLTDFLKLFIDHGGTPPYALVTPNAVNSQADADLLRGLFEQTYSGFKNWTKTALLSGGLDVKRIGSNIEEFAYPELRALTEGHICSVFGVPPIVAGIQAGLDASTYSNYAQARRAFFEDTVAGLWARLDGAFTRGLLAEFTDDQAISLEFDTSAVPALQEDRAALWASVQGMLGTGGLTLNQAQSALGYPGFGDDGEMLMVPLNLQPTRPKDLAILADMTVEPPQPVPAALTEGGGDAAAATDGDGPADDDAADAAEGAGGDRGATLGDRGGARRGHGAPSQAAAGVAESDQGPGSAMRHTGQIRTLPLETRARIATTNRRNVNRLTAKFAPRFAKRYRSQGERVAAAYSKRASDDSWWEDSDFPATTDKAIILEWRAQRDAVDIPWDDLDAEVRREAAALHEAAGTLAFASTAATLDIAVAWDISNPFVRQTLKRLALRVVGINDTTRQDVARVITTGIEEGLSTPQIAERLTGLFTETYKNRSLAIARTESQVAYNLGSADAYRASGVVQAMELHDNPSHTDSYGAEDGLSCAERDGVITDIDSVHIHIASEHPNGSLAVSPLLVSPLGAA